MESIEESTDDSDSEQYHQEDLVNQQARLFSKRCQVLQLFSLLATIDHLHSFDILIGLKGSEPLRLFIISLGNSSSITEHFRLFIISLSSSDSSINLLNLLFLGWFFYFLVSLRSSLFGGSYR